MNVTLIRPRQSEVVTLLPKGHRTLRAGENSRIVASEVDWRNPKMEGTERSYPLPVIFEWQYEGKDVLRSEVHLGTNDRLQDAQIVPGVEGMAEAFNLFIGQEYYWQVRIYTESGMIHSEVGCFHTDAMAPRLIRADGLTNIRDVGGWQNVNGQVIRQGILYRGSEMDTHHLLNDDAKRVLREQLISALNEWGEVEEPIRVKAERYLLAAGVTEKQIADLRANFLL